MSGINWFDAFIITGQDLITATNKTFSNQEEFETFVRLVVKAEARFQITYTKAGVLINDRYLLDFYVADSDYYHEPVLLIKATEGTVVITKDIEQSSYYTGISSGMLCMMIHTDPIITIDGYAVRAIQSVHNWIRTRRRTVINSNIYQSRAVSHRQFDYVKNVFNMATMMADYKQNGTIPIVHAALQKLAW